MTGRQELSKLNSKHHLPLKAKGMFNRRYKQIMKKASPKDAEKKALNFVKTRFKKIKGKWVDKNDHSNK